MLDDGELFIEGWEERGLPVSAKLPRKCTGAGVPEGGGQRVVGHGEETEARLHGEPGLGARLTYVRETCQ